MAELTRGQKFARNKGSDYMAKIGSKGGKNSPGSYGRVPGLARRAGARGALKRKINLLTREVEQLRAEGVEPIEELAELNRLSNLYEKG